MPTRAIGVLLFLPVPLVLFLLTRAPLGILASLGIGILLMLTHRRYARPWALARADRRCLWCGADAAPAAPAASGAAATPGELAAPAATAALDASRLAADDPLGRVEWRACRAEHARCLVAVLRWVARRGKAISLGILGTLAAFLAWALASGVGWLGRSSFEDAVAFFRLGIAISVLPLGWLAVREADPAPESSLHSPFPLHVPALIGLRAVLWLFRLIGLVWLVQGSLHVARRLAQLG